MENLPVLVASASLQSNDSNPDRYKEKAQVISPAPEEVAVEITEEVHAATNIPVDSAAKLVKAGKDVG
jgi:hypothetical protein